VRVRPSQKELVGRPLRDLKAKLPHPSIIAAIQRGDEAHVPGADDTLEPGDRAIVVGPAKIHGALKRLFTE